MLAEKDPKIFVIRFCRLAKFGERHYWVKFDPFWVYGNDARGALISAIDVFKKWPMEMPYKTPYVLTNPRKVDLYDKKINFYVFFVGRENEKKLYHIVPAMSIKEAKEVLKEAGFVKIYSGRLIKVKVAKIKDFCSCSEFGENNGASCVNCKKRLEHSLELCKIEFKSLEDESKIPAIKSYGVNDTCEICGEELPTDSYHCINCGQVQGQILECGGDYVRP